MSIWIFLAVIFNVFMALSVAILWLRTLRPPKEDPRLSRGLQLLQSKIAVLEDLSDRTETQVRQLTQILDERARSLQSKMLQAQETIMKIDQSMHKSLDVAEIFQDKIPHEEIIERNQQTKYVMAAKMANEGMTVEQILQEIDLPRNEVEFIAKINRDELTFNPELLPEWAKTKIGRASGIEAQMVDRVFHSPSKDLSSLQRIEADFKQAVRDAETPAELAPSSNSSFMQAVTAHAAAAANVISRATKSATTTVASENSYTPAQVTSAQAEYTAALAATASSSAKVNNLTATPTRAAAPAQAPAQPAGPIVRKVVFPRITVDKS